MTATTFPTQDLTRNETVLIDPAPGASETQAITAFLTDLKRRHKAGELTAMHVRAEDANGNVLDYHTSGHGA